MQEPLNTHPSTLFWLGQRLLHSLLKSKSGIAVLITLLCLAQSMESAKAASFNGNVIYITGTNGRNAITPQSYYTDRPSSYATTRFGANSLGTFNRINNADGTVFIDQLYINAEANTRASADENISSAQLLYRVYRADLPAQGGNPIPLPLDDVSGLTSGGDARWQNLKGNQQNLLEFATAPGQYVLEVSFSANVSSTTNPAAVILDNNGSTGYTATFQFQVNGQDYQTATWNYLKGSTDWFDPGNWSPYGVPTSNTDVIISAVPDADDPDGKAMYPTIDYQPGDPDYGTFRSRAQVRNITLLKDPTVVANRVFLLTQASTNLWVNGNFQDSEQTFRQSGGLLSFVGRGAQTIDTSPSVTDVLFTGGGTKTLTGLMTVRKTITFQMNSDGSPSGILITRTDRPNSFGVLLDGGQLQGEREGGFVQGVVVNNAPNVAIGEHAKFGNIGVVLTANANSPGQTTVVRTSSVYRGTGTSVSIRRSFLFTPNNPTSNFDLTFSYLDTERNGISPDKLLLFRSLTGRVPFEGLGKSSSTGATTDINGNNYVAATVTRTGITGRLNALFTLGNADNPLPVTITSFAAVAQGADAVVSWTTASETNNQGFEVQVSTDGVNFNKLGFLAANTPNSTTPHSYQYRDVTAGKQGTRYYRLRQLDLDGTESFVGPQAVTFSGAVAQTSLQGYPSPFSSEINLAMQTTAAGLATVTVTDGVGRQVRTWQPTLAAGASSLRLAELQSIPAGLYIVQVRYNDGQTQRLKMVKE